MTNHSSQTTGEPCPSQLTELRNTVVLENFSSLGVILLRSAILQQRWIWPTFFPSLSSHHHFNRKQTMFLKLQTNSTEDKNQQPPCIFPESLQIFRLLLNSMTYVTPKKLHRLFSCHWQLRILSLWHSVEIMLTKN